ncbi:MAG: aminotransferase class III-fold pyridoxal phosphate-dependent enzyme [Myxococcales bacterium]|nr:aminotransferase class III-fold pyridoxal phosphate-dependent enzyme [Myxococcales bacterium]
MLYSNHLHAIEELERRHRLEELLERYRLEAQFEDGRFCLVPWTHLRPLRYRDRLLTHSTLRDALEEANISAEFLERDGQLWVAFEYDSPSRRVFDMLEEGLIDWLERLREENPDVFLRAMLPKVRIPQSGDLVQSRQWLERLYAGNFVPRDKKPMVIDHARSHEAYLVSIDEQPLSILDSMSQIATLPAGFNSSALQGALDEGRFDDVLVTAAMTTEAAQNIADSFTQELRRHLPDALHHISFANSGAEANEKALCLARLYGPGGKRVVCFEGSFHGRTLVALYSTWNKKKREKYQIAGYESCFVPFPDNKNPDLEPPVDRTWLQLWNRQGTAAKQDLLSSQSDELMRREIESLLAVEVELTKGDVVAVVVEPMQSEGGDNYATARFFNALRRITRAYNTPLIFDEVQTGFGLGGWFFWHQRFNLKQPDGRPDYPDLVVGAKKAQVGIIASRWEDPIPGYAHPASMLRGSVHAVLADIDDPESVEWLVRAELARLERDLPPGLVRNCRATGFAFAIDLPTAAITDKVVDQRFYRGVMVYKAGEETLRYRLNRTFGKEEVIRVFGAVRDSLRLIVDLAGGEGNGGPELWARMNTVTVPKWLPPPPEPQDDDSIRSQVRWEFAKLHQDAAYMDALCRTMADDPDLYLEDQILRSASTVDLQAHTRGAELLGLNPDYTSSRNEVHLRLSEWSNRSDRFRQEVGVSLARFAASYLGPRIRRIRDTDWEQLRADIMAIERMVYERERQDDENFLRNISAMPDGIVLVAEVVADGRNQVVGFAFAAPLESIRHVDGPRDDVFLDKHNVLYSVDVAVHPDYQRRNLGSRLKSAQLRYALSERTADGQVRYAFVAGRNRIGHTTEMRGINAAYGAYKAGIYDNQYGIPGARALYYRIALRRNHRMKPDLPEAHNGPLQFADGITMPLGPSHSTMLRVRDTGFFDGAALNKLTLSNFVTRDHVRYLETLRAVAPKNTPHLYLTSCRDEMVDKSVRVLKAKRPEGKICIGFRGGYWGSNTAAARSLTDWDGHPLADKLGWFDWPLLPHPGSPIPGDAATSLTADEIDTLGLLSAQINDVGESRVLGIFVEAVQERTGYTFSQPFWKTFGEIAEKHRIPIVINETATGRFRSGNGMWKADFLPVVPDMVLWFGGGQLGHIFVSETLYVDTPLELISTWDGDELSALRCLWELRVARHEPVRERGEVLWHALRGVWRRLKITGGLYGEGLYVAVDVRGVSGVELQSALARHQIFVGLGRNNRVLVVPPLSVSEEQIARFVSVLEWVLRDLLEGISTTPDEG